MVLGVFDCKDWLKIFYLLDQDRRKRQHPGRQPQPVDRKSLELAQDGLQLVRRINRNGTAQRRDGQWTRHAHDRHVVADHTVDQVDRPAPAVVVGVG